MEALPSSWEATRSFWDSAEASPVVGRRSVVGYTLNYLESVLMLSMRRVQHTGESGKSELLKGSNL